MTNQRVTTIFERYIFDAHKYQQYFNASTTEIIEKLSDAVWPFQPANQPEGIVLEYTSVCKQFFGDQYSYDPLAQNNITQEDPEIESVAYAQKDGKSVHNPFMKDENSDLSFLSRNADQLEESNS